MSIEIHPRKIRGRWTDGYALDLHTTGSTFLGYDGNGHPQFDTTRSELGELLYELKYGGSAAVTGSIAEAAADFLVNQWKIEVDLIVSVPPSNTERRGQPVLEVAREISVRTKIELCSLCIEKIRQTPQLKNVYDYKERTTALEGAFRVDAEKTSGKRILLFDDLFRSGATMNAITEHLIEEGKAETVYALTLTQTRSTL
jgi:competence protein ComFC